MQSPSIENRKRIAGRYEVIRHLGSGSAGQVFLAKDTELKDSLVALKELYPHHCGNLELVKAFQELAHTTRQLTHPNIVYLYDIEVTDGNKVILSMEYSHGTSLRTLLASTHAFTPQESCLLLLEVAKALSYAHSKNVYHRALSPNNVLVDQDGKIKVTDFGLSALLATESGLTRTGESTGAPQYTAPEQFLSPTPTIEADIYSFGILAFELLTGEPPFVHESLYQLAMLHRSEPLPELGEDVPAELRELICRCCAKLPEDRPRDFTAIIRELSFHTATAAPLAAVVSSLLPKHKPRKRLRKALFSIVALFGAVTPFVPFILKQTSTRMVLGPKVLLVDSWCVTNNLSCSSLTEWLRIKMSLNLPLYADIKTVMRVTSKEIPASVNSFISAGGNLDVRDRDTGQHLLHRLVTDSAPLATFEAVLSELEKIPFLINTQDYEGNTPLMLAIRLNQQSIATRLLQDDASAQIKDFEGITPIEAAIRSNNSMALNQMIRMEKVDPNSLVSDGGTVLDFAARKGSLRLVNALLAVGSNTCVKNSDGSLPLYSVLRATETLIPGRDLIVQFMIPNQECLFVNRDNNGQTALHIAASVGDDLSSMRLITLGSRIDAKDIEGRTTIALAYSSGHPKTAEKILHRIGTTAIEIRRQANPLLNALGIKPIRFDYRSGQLN